MVDNLKPEDRRRTMQAVKGKGTRLERQLSAMLAGMRISGWRKNVMEVIGKPDIVFYENRIAIFLDGCFWHGCPICNRKLPETNRQYWEQKIDHNRELANTYDEKLSKAGWYVIRIWEHDMKKPATRAIIRSKIRSVVGVQHTNGK